MKKINILFLSCTEGKSSDFYLKLKNLLRYYDVSLVSDLSLLWKSPWEGSCAALILHQLPAINTQSNLRQIYIKRRLQDYVSSGGKILASSSCQWRQFVNNEAEVLLLDMQTGDNDDYLRTRLIQAGLLSLHDNPNDVGSSAERSSLAMYFRNGQQRQSFMQSVDGVIMFTDSAESFRFSPHYTSTLSGSDQDEGDNELKIEIKDDLKQRGSSQFNADVFFQQLQPDSMIKSLITARELKSTQSLLVDNYKFQSLVPDGTLVVADNQSNGRGRSGNSWISDQGALQFSFIHNYDCGDMLKVVFLQYIMSLAVVKAVKQIAQSNAFPIAIKWPNDIYVAVQQQDGNSQQIKVGGILVSPQLGNTCKVIIGCGLNVYNDRPTVSIQSVFKQFDATQTLELSKEVLCAEIMNQYTVIYRSFFNSGVYQFKQEYYRHWLHSNQKVSVKLDGEVDQRKEVTIKGIGDDGFLLAVDATGQQYQLQPDGNRFDITRNLLFTKL
ncbi:hypothetical protein MP228_006688 [Amoeboaphelidium protococcarum]|nr:hypothetical protein MP228_006688 [Amoeboaphelidium protococcarum]